MYELVDQKNDLTYLDQKNDLNWKTMVTMLSWKAPQKVIWKNFVVSFHFNTKSWIK